MIEAAKEVPVMKKQTTGKLMTSVVIILSLGAMFLIFTQFLARMNAELNTSVVDYSWKAYAGS